MMALYILMTIPPQPPPFSPTTITMYDPRTQSSHTNFSERLIQNEEASSNCSNDQELVQFRPNNHQENDDSGVCSPPLWKNSPSPSQPLLSHHHIYMSLSPNSRTQAIVRGQRELMEMVKNMPESSYELSLKDLVEHHKMETQVENQNLQQRRVKRQESKKNMTRSGSFENKGLFLKMVFPFSLSSKKKKNYFASDNSTSGKVSPKPEVIKGGGERDWWKKKFTGSSDSDSSRTSSNSGSTTASSGSSSGGSRGGNRKKKGFLTGCWPNFQSRRSKNR